MKRQRFWIFIGILLLIVGINGLLMDRMFSPGFSRSDEVFLEGSGIDYAEAKRIYLQAGKALDSNRSTEAIELYDKIKDHYLRLRPLIYLHKSQAYAALGDEAEVQSMLKVIIDEYSGTFFECMALYEMGQSSMRSKQYELAKKSFESAVKKPVESNLTIGSHYYLGELAKKVGDREAALNHWRFYIQKSPDGTFSADVARSLGGLPYGKTAEDYEWIGVALYNKKEWQEAYPYLEKGKFANIWLELGKSYIQSGRVKQGINTLEKGLYTSGLVPPHPALSPSGGEGSANLSANRAEEAVKAILATYPSGKEKVAKLQQLLNKILPTQREGDFIGLNAHDERKPATGGDFILWELKQLSSGDKRAKYGEQLLKRYPESNWAPETSWELLWPLYKNGSRAAEFLDKADHHLKLYPTSISAPRVLFWKAKFFMAQGKTNIAYPLFKDLIGRYPGQYYAFRAQQIVSGKDLDPWRTIPAMSYPPAAYNKSYAESLSKFVENEDLAPVVAELIKLESSKDIDAIIQAYYLKDPPKPLISLIYSQEKRYPESIRQIRDYLDEKRKIGSIIRDPAVLKLLYPLHYSNEISRHSRRNNLDPLLVQAIMRQESYFNRFAVSSSKAIGLMQLLPSTAKDVAKWENMGGFIVGSLFEPETNVRLGTRYLGYLHEKFNRNSMLAVGGYNGGPGAMSRWAGNSLSSDPDLFIESIPYAQTRDYIKEVFSHYWNYRLLYGGS